MTDIVTTDHWTGRTLVLCVVDKSGSMDGLTPEVVSGVNQWKQEIADEDRGVLFSLIFFDTQVYRPVVNTPITEVPDLFDDRVGISKTPSSLHGDRIPYRPSGMTALYDAFMAAVTIAEREKKITDRVLVNCVTDGQENSSREHTLTHLHEAIKRLTDTGTWTFTFLSSHPEAFEDAKTYGVAAGNVSGFAATSVGTQTAFTTASGSTRTYLRGATGQSASFYGDESQDTGEAPPVVPESLQGSTEASRTRSRR